MCSVLFFLLIFCLGTVNGIIYKLQNSVDLTWPFDNNTLYWRDTQPFVFTKKIAEVRIDGVWYSSNEFCAGEHGGTHFDAPFHFSKFGWKVHEVPLSKLIAQGIMIDLKQETQHFKDEAILLPSHLQKWEEEHGPIPQNSVILVNFGWSQYYTNSAQYLGSDENNKLHFPGISKDAAEWIVNKNKVVGVGIDTASVDPGKSEKFSAHEIFSKNQIYALENVKIPPVFPEKGFMLYVMPMNIAEGSGAPLRLIAVPFDEDTDATNLSVKLQTPWYGHFIVVLSSVALFFMYATHWME